MLFHDLFYKVPDGVADNRQPRTTMPIKRTTRKFMQPMIIFHCNHWLPNFSFYHYCRTVPLFGIPPSRDTVSFINKLKNSINATLKTACPALRGRPADLLITNYTLTLTGTTC